jgi:5-(carboxyamino)imidazole ribonucleotide mutase
MRINVVFGSTSDSKIAEALVNDLRSQIPELTIINEVCSAHREPERLREMIKTHPCDLWIAGAGLAAHLPGVVASQTTTPVIGIACGGVLEGHDSLLSILQMPKGVPVLTSGIEKTDSIVKFVKWYHANRAQPPVFRIHAPSWAERMTHQLQEPLEKLDWEFVKHSPDVDHPPSMFSLVLADLFAPPGSADSPEGLEQLLPGAKTGIWLGVPVFAEPPYKGDLRSIGRLLEAGGLWVGVNNITNLQLSLLQLWPTSSKSRDLLNQLRGGQTHSVR